MKVAHLTPLLIVPCALFGQERPNILWLTFEDTSPYELGCYGNTAASTPVIDSLAKVGILFTNVYAGGPQSSPSRSTLITGAYCTTYAMDYHRGKVNTPDGILFPQYLRNAGYYCTNNQKTDYNTTTKNSICWDECSNKASYNSPLRGSKQPFFAVFNSNLTHMSRLASVHTDGRRDFAKEGLGANRLPLPPHVPDLPEIHSDYAFHVEGVNDVDKWVKLFLDDLKAKGLDEDTIIFIFSDHGGCLPRGKAFAYETSFRVPMIVYIPKKWEYLSSIKPGSTTNDMVHFVDMGPTMLSLADVDIPQYMQGTAFMGKQTGPKRTYQYGNLANRTIHYVPTRTISDGRYKYIRYYIPYKKDNLYNYFQWEMPANIYWDKAYFEGKLSEIHRRPFEQVMAEALYDLQNDPFELNNLANEKGFSEIKETLKDELNKQIRDTKDIGFLPITTRNGKSPYSRVRVEGYDLELLYKLTDMTLSVTEDDIPLLSEIADSDRPDEFKFWAAVNLGVLARNGSEKTLPSLRKLLSVKDEMIQQESAAALCYTSAIDEGFSFLLTHPDQTAALEMLSLEEQIRDKFPTAIIDMLLDKSTQFEEKEMTSMPGQKDGINHRKVLVNLGLLKADEMYGPNVYDIGLKVNTVRRKFNALP